MDYSQINNALNSAAQPAPTPEAKISVVSLGGVNEYNVQIGMTIGTFKAMHGLEGTKVVDQSGTTLENSATIQGNTQLFISTPKKNG